MAAGDVSSALVNLKTKDCVSFNGNADLISLAYPELTAFLSTSHNTTRAGWIYLNSYNNTGATYSFFYQVGGNQRNVEILQTGKLQFQDLSAGSLIESTSTLPLNKWTHICCIRRGDNLEIYINGVLDNSGAYATATNASSAVMSVGGPFGGASAYSLNGGIKDFVYYRRALSTDEVTQLANNVLVTSGILVFLPLRRDTLDYSGNNYVMNNVATNIKYSSFEDNISEEIKSERVTATDKFFLIPTSKGKQVFTVAIEEA